MTAVAVFMSFLDVTIVNIAFPDLRRTSRRPRWPRSRGCSTRTPSSSRPRSSRPGAGPTARPAPHLPRRRRRLPRASAACGLAPTPELLVAARAVQALGAAPLVPTSLALLLPEFPLERRATATALWGATGARGRGRPARRWAGCWSSWQLALGLLREPADRAAGAARRRGGCCARRATRTAAPAGRRWAPPCLPSASARWRWRSSKARRGAGRARGRSRALRRRRRAAASPSASARHASRTRWST